VQDSTILDDADATQDTSRSWSLRTVGSAGCSRPSKPDCVWDDPHAKQALVSGLVNDALAVPGG
jgi:hypothetical protein